MNPAGNRLARQIAFLVEIDRLKGVLRRSYPFDAERRENSAEHSWHVAMAAMMLAEHADAEIDRERVTRMLLVHDVVEIDAGDVPVYDVAAREKKAEEERRAAARIFGLLPEDLAAELRDLWEEFEAQETAEARFAKAVDRLVPVLHNAFGGGRTWQDLGVVEAQVREVNSVIAHASESLWRYVSETLDEAVATGLLPGVRDE